MCGIPAGGDGGIVIIALPVRSDRTGRGGVRVIFACGSEAQPAGLCAAAHLRPQGPSVVVEAGANTGFGESLDSWYASLETGRTRRMDDFRIKEFAPNLGTELLGIP